jgi:hypothetical protein
MGYRDLANTLLKMIDLRVLTFPRSAARHKDNEQLRVRMTWPPKLEELTLSGNLSEFVDNDVSDIQELTSITTCLNGWKDYMLPLAPSTLSDECNVL